jgi:hypothetical protein
VVLIFVFSLPQIHSLFFIPCKICFSAQPPLARSAFLR